MISENSQLDRIESELSKIYATGRVTDYKGKQYALEPGLEEVMARSRNSSQLKWAWKGWRDESGAKMKDLYKDLVNITNEGAHENGRLKCLH